MSLILVSINDLNLFFCFFEVCLRQIREYFYGTFYQSFSCTLVFSGDLYLHGFMNFNEYTEIDCLSLNNCMILKK